jgi:hypothetical protein
MIIQIVLAIPSKLQMPYMLLRLHENIQIIPLSTTLRLDAYDDDELKRRIKKWNIGQ